MGRVLLAISPSGLIRDTIGDSIMPTELVDPILLQWNELLLARVGIGILD